MSLDVKSEIQVYDACIKWARNRCHLDGGEEEATKEQLREKLGRVLNHIRFPVMTSEELSKIEQDGCLLIEEQKEKVYSIRNSLAGTGEIDARSRVDKKPILVCIDRYSTSDLSTNAEPKKETHAISFDVNKEALLAGVGIYVTNEYHYDISLELRNNFNDIVTTVSKDKVTFDPKLLETDECHGSIHTVLFSEPVLVTANAIFKLMVNLKKTRKKPGKSFGICNIIQLVGEDGRVKIRDEKSGLVIHFTEANLKDKSTNPESTPTSGQIPQLFFLVN